MTLDSLDVVDAIGREADGTVVLTVIDGWDWSDERRHLEALEDKLNGYLRFIESGQIREDYPAAIGARLRIDVLTRTPIPETARLLIEEADATAHSLGTTVRHVEATPYGDQPVAE
jgi:hypothetical protein